MKVISWYPVLTDHQSYTLVELQQASNCALKVYVAKQSHVERQAQGWVNQHASTLSPELIPGRGWFRFAVRHLREHRDAVHLFGSPFEQSKLIVVLLLAVAMGLRVYLISEPYSTISAGYQNDKQRYLNWLKAKLRPLLYGAYGLLLRRRIGGVFAISCLAVAQYKRIGIADNKIFPFAYFVPCQDGTGAVSAPAIGAEKTRLRVVFVGNLIARKGIDVLISTLHMLNRDAASLTLDVYGPGDPELYSFDQTSVRYCGLIPFGNAQTVMANYDVLVLPSRYDGWGVVGNEALMAGVPVICSDQAGVGAVIEKWRCGAIFASEDVSDLAAKLQDLLIHPERLEGMRLATRAAGATLAPRVAGQYMFDILRQDCVADERRTKPECPWYDCR